MFMRTFERECIDLVDNPGFVNVRHDMVDLMNTALTEREQRIQNMNHEKKRMLQAAEYDPKNDPFLKSFPRIVEQVVEVKGKKYKFTIEIEAKFIVDLDEQAAKILDIKEDFK